MECSDERRTDAAIAAACNQGVFSVCNDFERKEMGFVSIGVDFNSASTPVPLAYHNPSNCQLPIFGVLLTLVDATAGTTTDRQIIFVHITLSNAQDSTDAHAGVFRVLVPFEIGRGCNGSDDQGDGEGDKRQTHFVKKV
ncbi:hypothetical protein N7532_001188 [Penicillium argentinense]|uniref:Uncharacterized protein n=1 Tax=Penicillium argentinense TaxID=1131581 RepID=A0A9W9KM74_9EURO|nr:uncharacterized protein N7532_001188 [Penicillium argentinense]KAJ5110653.1 hypothetical protein N7532_001188 [Penicillium argentinense]